MYRQGFTLLELMISIVLMVSIMAIAGAAMRLGYRSLEKGRKMTDTLERVRASVTIMNAQIQSASPLSIGSDGKAVSFEGEGDALRFPTNYSIWGGARGHVSVEYRVRDDDGRKSLYATESVAETGRQRETRLFKGYASIYFLYPEEEKWVYEWDDPSRVPEEVRLVLVSGQDNSVALTFPVRVR